MLLNFIESLKSNETSGYVYSDIECLIKKIEGYKNN